MFTMSILHSQNTSMATQTRGLIRDQNLNVHFDAAPFGVKSNVLKAQKNGGLGGRKVRNNVSISGRPSTLQTSKKHNPKNVISIGEDIGPSKMTSFGRKRNVSKAPKKAQAGGRKALNDLTNSGKHPHQASKKSQDKNHHGYSMQLGSPLSGKLKPESPLWYLEMEEMFELEYEDQSQWKKPSVQSPCGSPISR
ncbi:unnamed protein product [Camellia sinensis]